MIGRRTNPKVHYVLPSEGGTIWIDSYAIPKGSPNPEAAYKFMSYLMRPEVSAKVTQLSKVASTNDTLLFFANGTEPPLQGDALAHRFVTRDRGAPQVPSYLLVGQSAVLLERFPVSLR